MAATASHAVPAPAFDATRRAPFAGTWNGPAASPTFRLGFLRKGLRTLNGPTVHIDATDARRPVRICTAKDSAFLYTLMPVPA